MAWISTFSADLERDTSQYLSRADGAELSITGNLTIACFVKVESEPASGESREIVTKYRDTGDQRSYLFEYKNAGGTKELVLYLSSLGTAASLLSCVHTTTLTAGTWYHVAVTFNATTQNVYFYVNAVESAAKPNMGTAIYDSTAEFRIGTDHQATPEGNWDGLIHDVRVWARVLSGTEITNLYNYFASTSAVVAFSNGANLQGWWGLNNALTDASGNNLTLTNVNTATFVSEVPFHKASNSDTLGTPTDSFNASSLYYIITKSEIAGAPVDSGRAGYGWSSQDKSSAGSITNQDKSF